MASPADVHAVVRPDVFPPTRVAVLAGVMLALDDGLTVVERLAFLAAPDRALAVALWTLAVSLGFARGASKLHAERYHAEQVILSAVRSLSERRERPNTVAASSASVADEVTLRQRAEASEDRHAADQFDHPASAGAELRPDRFAVAVRPDRVFDDVLDG